MRGLVTVYGSLTKNLLNKSIQEKLMIWPSSRIIARRTTRTVIYHCNYKFELNEKIITDPLWEWTCSDALPSRRPSA